MAIHRSICRHHTFSIDTDFDSTCTLFPTVVPLIPFAWPTNGVRRDGVRRGPIERGETAGAIVDGYSNTSNYDGTYTPPSPGRR